MRSTATRKRGTWKRATTSTVMTNTAMTTAPRTPTSGLTQSGVKLAVNEMAYQLAAQDPANASVYAANAASYGEQLDELHAWIQEHVKQVPPERRLLVTSHDSLGYLAAAYGFEVVGLIIPSLAPDVEPSAEHLAELIDVVRDNNVPAVFGETTVSDKLAQAVARETGAEVVQLYSGSWAWRAAAPIPTWAWCAPTWNELWRP